MHLTGPLGTQCTEKLLSLCPLWVPNNGRCAPTDHIFPSPALCPVKVRLVNKPLDYSVELTLLLPWSFPKNLPALLRLAPSLGQSPGSTSACSGWGEGGLVPIAVPGLSLCFPAAHCWWSAGCGGLCPQLWSAVLDLLHLCCIPGTCDSGLSFLWEEGFCLVLDVIAHPSPVLYLIHWHGYFFKPS